MSIAEATPKTPATAQTERALIPENRFVLWNMDWEFYEFLLDKLGDRPNRITYDRGSVEFMSPSQDHEYYKYLLAVSSE